MRGCETFKPMPSAVHQISPSVCCAKLLLKIRDVARGQGACRLPCAHTRLILLHTSPLHVRERGRLIISGFECALCGRQCRISAKRMSLDTAYDGAGLPPAKELERFVPDNWKIKNSMRTVALPALPTAK